MRSSLQATRVASSTNSRLQTCVWLSRVSGVQIDQLAEPDAGAGATADYIQPGPPEQAQHSGPYTRPQQVSTSCFHGNHSAASLPGHDSHVQCMKCQAYFVRPSQAPVLGHNKSSCRVSRAPYWCLGWAWTVQVAIKCPVSRLCAASPDWSNMLCAGTTTA